MSPGGSMQYEPIAISSESTVVAEFEAKIRDSSAYQSEAQLEDAFIALLKEQAYEYLSFDSEDALLLNLRKQIQDLNKDEFSDVEWERFFGESISGERY